MTIGALFRGSTTPLSPLRFTPAPSASFVFASLLSGSLWGAPAAAATIAPPMLDITRQCDANTRHNVTAMSECVVAESEARAELLQKWDKLADADVQKCIKIGRKARRLPYSAMAKCLAVEPVDLQAPPPQAAPAK